jgi:hypothetical protein
MLFVETLKYLETKLFLLITFYSGTSLIIKILTALNMNMSVYIYSRLIIVGVITLAEFLLLSK